MQKYIPYDRIMQEIEEIQEGDIVYVVSDILELSIRARENKNKLDINKFIDSILEKVGPSGTVLIPTFNWGFCRGETFDIKRTISKTGALGNAAMKRSDFKRTKHPIYSFMVWGKDKEILCEMDPIESFGTDSVFGYLHKNRAKSLVIGLHSLAGLTFVHYVEQQVGVPFRYHKNFTAKYINESGAEETKTYSMYVRDLDMNPEEINCFQPMSEIIEENGISKSYSINDVQFHVMNLEDIYSVVKEDILNNDSVNLYTYNHL